MQRNIAALVLEYLHYRHIQPRSGVSISIFCVVAVFYAVLIVEERTRLRVTQLSLPTWQCPKRRHDSTDSADQSPFPVGASHMIPAFNSVGACGVPTSSHITVYGSLAPLGKRASTCSTARHGNRIAIRAGSVVHSEKPQLVLLRLTNQPLAEPLRTTRRTSSKGQIEITRAATGARVIDKSPKNDERL